ncbi:MAG TPA: MFS transporter, partial [Gammaproteobacteria bacterium]|nr:MFS transporter [Gammaproteobacteria bacterium]
MSWQTPSALAASRRIGVVTFIGGLGGGLVFPILPALGLQLGIAGGLIGLILSA